MITRQAAIRRAWLVAGATATLVACRSADTVLAPGAQLAIGTWGGDGAGAIVTDTLAHVHVGCTFGDIRGRVPLDADGRFTMDGTYVLRAYPVLVGPTLPAQFSGRVQGNTLTIAIAVNDTVARKVVALGPATMVLGKEPQLGPCPICRVPGVGERAGAPPAPSRQTLRELLRHIIARVW